MAVTEPTYIGQVASVTGGVIRVRMRLDTASTLIMVEGDSYRVGQVGAFFRLPLGYSQLYAICTQVGADAAPPLIQNPNNSSFTVDDVSSAGFRWMTVVLFGESLGNKFERGVGQYPTIGDEVHIVTTKDLAVIYWALPLSALLEICMGGVQPNIEAAIREKVFDMKKEALAKLKTPFPPEAITADSPVPFSLKKLWFELDDFERQTFSATGAAQTATSLLPLAKAGDPEKLIPNSYPPATPNNSAPYQNSKKRHIDRQIDLFLNRLRDSRFNFLLNPADGFTPTQVGEIKNDLDKLVSDWVGHDKPITILDVSGVPSEILPTVVGTMLHIVYEALFWAGDLPISGRKQPLLVLIEEAHKFIPEKIENPASRILQKIAKEGRKYGIGLMVVTQRPTEVDSTILSQCGTMIALRTTNSSDRGKVSFAELLHPRVFNNLFDLIAWVLRPKNCCDCSAPFTNQLASARLHLLDFVNLGKEIVGVHVRQLRGFRHERITKLQQILG